MFDWNHFWFYCQKVLPLTYDDSLSYYEVLCKCRKYINELIDISKENAEGLIELKEYVENYFNNLDVDAKIEEAIDERVDELIESGQLQEMLSQSLSFILTPEMYGAVGDGTTDDSAAFSDMLSNQLSSDYNYKVIVLSKNYNLTGTVSGAFKLPVVGIKGATIKSHANVMKFAGNASFSGVTFEYDTAHTGLSWEEDSVIADSITVEHCKFLYQGRNDTTRSGSGLRARAKKSYVNDCYFSGNNKGVVFNNSSYVDANGGTDSIVISNIVGENVQTLVDIEGTYTTDYAEFVKNVHISNIILSNSTANKASMSAVVGYDAVLMGGVRYFTVENVISINAKERAVYVANCKYGNINHVLAIGSEGMKISGTTIGSNRITSEKISVNDLFIYKPTSGFGVFVYDVNEIAFDKIVDYGESGDDNSLPIIQMSRYADRVTFKNVKGNTLSRGLVYIYDTTGYATEISNVTFEEIYGDNFPLSIDFNAFTFNTTGTLRNILIKDVMISPFSISYNSSSRLKGFIAANNITNLLIFNCAMENVGVTTNPIILNNCSNVKIQKTKFWALSPQTYSDMGLTEDSDYITYTISNTNTHKYIIERDHNPLRRCCEMNVYFPCARNIFGELTANKTILISGPSNGIVKVVSGSGTASGDVSYDNSTGIVTVTNSGWHKVTLINQ